MSVTKADYSVFSILLPVVDEGDQVFVDELTSLWERTRTSIE